jgi:WD40 repeat protein
LIDKSHRILAGTATGQIVRVTSFRDGGSLAVHEQFGDRHAAGVTAFHSVLGRDGSEVWTVSGAEDGSIRLWNARSMSCALRLQGDSFIDISR